MVMFPGRVLNFHLTRLRLDFLLDFPAEAVEVAEADLDLRLLALVGFPGDGGGKNGLPRVRLVRMLLA